MGRKEDNIKRAQTIIHDKARIRNIGTAAHIDHGADVRDVRFDSLWTRSLELSSGKTTFAQITHAWRLRATEPLVEVESRDGRRIRTTPEHPFVVASRDGLEYKEARALCAGGALAVARRL